MVACEYFIPLSFYYRLSESIIEHAEEIVKSLSRFSFSRVLLKGSLQNFIELSKYGTIKGKCCVLLTVCYKGVYLDASNEQFKANT